MLSNTFITTQKIVLKSLATQGLLTIFTKTNFSKIYRILLIMVMISHKKMFSSYNTKCLLLHLDLSKKKSFYIVSSPIASLIKRKFLFQFFCNSLFENFCYTTRKCCRLVCSACKRNILLLQYYKIGSGLG